MFIDRGKACLYRWVIFTFNGGVDAKLNDAAADSDMYTGNLMLYLIFKWYFCLLTL